VELFVLNVANVYTQTLLWLA